jgi:hypothetical protein
MQLDEVKRKVAEMEVQILSSISNFEEESGLSVSDINLVILHGIGKRGSLVKGVSIEVKI